MAAVPVLRQGRRHARLRPLARAPRAIRQRHHEGALPEVDRARRLCVHLRHRRRRAAGDDRSVTTEHLGRLLGDVLLEHLSRAPQLPGRDADDLFHRAQSRLAADERLDELGVQDPARNRARVRADGALRAARPWDDARDAAAGLRAHRAREGAPLPARRRPARAPELADPGDHRRRPAARVHHHRCVRDRADLQHPRHRPVLRHGRQRARLLGRDGPDRAALGDHHLREPDRRHPLRDPRPADAGRTGPDGCVDSHRHPRRRAGRRASARVRAERRSGSRTSGRTRGAATGATAAPSSPPGSSSWSSSTA